MIATRDQLGRQKSRGEISQLAEFGGKMKLSRISFLFLLFFLVIPSVVLAQSVAEKRWKPFWAKFSTAVNNKNRTTIKEMASKDFDGGGGETITDWLKRVDKEKAWGLVQKSVRNGTYISPYAKTTRGTRDNYLWFIYKDGSWHFVGVD